MLLAAVAACGLAATSAHAQSDKPKEFRVGLLGGENTQDRLARYGKFQELLQQKLGIPVKLFPAADCAGVMQEIAAGQLEMASFGANSGIKSLEDMKGHSLAWADPNSTSGYLIPSATLKAKGIKLDDGAYFSKTGFSGGHEQGVVAVLNKQYDGAVTWTSGHCRVRRDLASRHGVHRRDRRRRSRSGRPDAFWHPAQA